MLMCFERYWNASTAISTRSWVNSGSTKSSMSSLCFVDGSITTGVNFCLAFSATLYAVLHGWCECVFASTGRGALQILDNAANLRLEAVDAACWLLTLHATRQTQALWHDFLAEKLRKSKDVVRPDAMVSPATASSDLVKALLQKAVATFSTWTALDANGGSRFSKQKHCYVPSAWKLLHTWIVLKSRLGSAVDVFEPRRNSLWPIRVKKETFV